MFLLGEKIIGRVKRLIQESYFLELSSNEFKLTETEGYCSDYYEAEYSNLDNIYYLNGKIAEQVIFSVNAKAIGSKTYKYDDFGRLNLVIINDSEGEIKEHYVYNANGDLSNVDNGYERKSYHYNENNKLEEYFYFGQPYPMTHSSISYKYDLFGNIIEEVHDSSIIRYSYSENQIKKEKHTIIEGEIREQMFYDTLGREIKAKILSHKGDETLIVKEYKENGQLKEAKKFFNGELIEKKEFFFDEFGRVIEEQFYKKGKSETLTNHTYATDNVGNWISMRVAVNNKPKYYIKRKIEYFDEFK